MSQKSTNLIYTSYRKNRLILSLPTTPYNRQYWTLCSHRIFNYINITFHLVVLHFVSHTSLTFASYTSLTLRKPNMFHYVTLHYTFISFTFLNFLHFMLPFTQCPVASCGIAFRRLYMYYLLYGFFPQCSGVFLQFKKLIINSC